jgi:amidohydrolase
MTFNFEEGQGNFNDHPLFGWVRELRRDFHRHPEVGFEETRTAEKIREILSQLGVPLVAAPEAPTGVVGCIQGGQPGPTIGVRADIDALPMQEAADKPYASKYAGRMHACGHDAHTAILLGVARSLMTSGRMDDMPGRVKLIFQPAEETLGGAKTMVASRVMENPHIDAMVALHVSNQYPLGTIGLPREYAYAAADWFDLKIHGRGVHAAMPHRGVDPIMAGVNLYQGFQSIVSRRVNPADVLVLSVSRFIAGDAPNIIPDEAFLAGTLRYFKSAVRTMAREQVDRLIEGVERGFGVKVDLNYTAATCPVKNDAAIVALIQNAAAEIVGEEKITNAEPTTGSEDFSEYLKYAPGAMLFLGSRAPDSKERQPAHSPTFDIDERCLPLGIEIMTRICLDFLSQRCDRSVFKTTSRKKRQPEQHFNNCIGRR